MADPHKQFRIDSVQVSSGEAQRIGGFSMLSGGL
jgi:hypothetical protein